MTSTLCARPPPWTDYQFATGLPSLLPVLRKARTDAQTSLPPVKLLTPQEAAVEAEVQAVLAADPLGDPVSGSPKASVAWAEETAMRIRTLDGKYRGLPAVAFWGRVVEPPLEAPARRVRLPDDLHALAPRPRITRMNRRPQVRQAPEDEDDESVGIWMVQLDDSQEHVEDPMGLQQPAATTR